MEVALIPPTSLLDYTYLRPRQMMLPKPAGDFTYQSYYQHMARNPGQHVILDNGMFEKPALEAWQIISTGRLFGVQEIVLPDVWADPIETLTQIQSFLAYWRERTTFPWKPSFQAVAHGGTMAQAQNFVTAIADNVPTVTTIGISRSLSRSRHNVRSRIDLAYWIHRTFPGRYDIHFLGFDDNYHEEIYAAKDLVRSVDTAAPFIAAYWKHNLSEMKEAPRPLDYFDLASSMFRPSLVTTNIEYLDGLARG